MKSKVSISIAALVTVFALSVHAGEQGHGKGHGGEHEKAQIPATLPEIWTAVQKHKGELDAVIKAKKLKDVHLHAFAIRDLVNAMPAKSSMLSVDNKKKLEKGVKTVAQLAKALDDAGDSNNQAKTEEGQKKLDTVLKAITALYSKDALKAPAGKAPEHKH